MRPDASPEIVKRLAALEPARSIARLSPTSQWGEMPSRYFISGGESTKSGESEPKSSTLYNCAVEALLPVPVAKIAPFCSTQRKQTCGEARTVVKKGRT